MKSTKREKQFLKTMILASVVGLSIMMVTMMYVIKAFGEKSVPMDDEGKITIEEDIQIRTKKSNGVIHDIDYKNKEINIWQYKEEKYLKVNSKNAELKDSYGKPIVINELELGEIIEFEYEVPTKNVVSLKKSPSAWKRANITDIEIDTNDRIIKTGNDKLEYTSNLLVLNEINDTIGIKDIGDMDTLLIQGVENTAWSIKILESPGYIKVINPPTTIGKVAIDNNKIYSLEEAVGKVPAQIGERKVVIHMQGYKPFADYIEITKGKISTIDLKNVDKLESILDVKVLNTNENYTVQIDNKRYNKGELIKIFPGKYRIKVTSKGYKTFDYEIELVEGEQKLEISLEKEEQEPEKDTNKEKEKEKDNNDQKEDNENKTVQIIIETEPENAQVFVSGVYKGTTPALTGLKPGEYNISIEKEGYSTLYTTIVVDSGNAQKSFLYTLDKE